ncbi:arginase family protein [Candidatus Woesearchaeota archaeon]|nr:arginase family protein [Candidatus Woesearchaeota archaeon]
MRIVKIEESDGRPETKGCKNGASAVLTQLKDIWLSEDHKILNYEIVNDNGDLFLGGDHSISFEIFSKNPCEGLLIFDAHPDVYHEFNSATHLDWLKFLIDEGKVNGEKVMIVGLRSFHKKEINYLREKKIKFLTMKNIFENGVVNVCDGIMEFVSGFKSLYISIDIDVVDPAFAPGVGYVEPGGLTSRELIYLMQRLKNLKNLKKIDIVEINKDKDVNNMTSKLAAKLVYELA